MQKKIIALAVAGLVSGAAFAQSNVTVYGQADASIGRYTANGVAAETITGLASGTWASSRLGFKGQEDLGNGLKAIFTLEYGLAVDENSGVGSKATGSVSGATVSDFGNARETTVGLSGGFGTFKAGRQATLGHAVINKFDAERATNFSTLSQFRKTGDGFTRTISNSSRADKTMVYVSPNLSGFSLGGSYTFGNGPSNYSTNQAYMNRNYLEAPMVFAYDDNNQIKFGSIDDVDQKDKGHTVGMMADYTNGPLAFAYVHHVSTDIGGNIGLDQKENLIAASYDFKAVKVLGSYQTFKTETEFDIMDKDRVYAIGVQVPVGPKLVIDAGYAKLDDRLVDEGDAAAYSVQASYHLSKRTLAYAGYTRVSNDNAVKFAAVGGVTPGFGQSSSGFGVGIRHNF